MPLIDPAKAEHRSGSGYPEPFASAMKKRHFLRVSDLAGLTQFGVNVVTVEPGGMSALRHWHEAEDEFVYMVEGELVLVEEGAETVLNPGAMAGFKAGVPNGHHLVNRSATKARFLVVGTRATSETAYYPDVDLVYRRQDRQGRYERRDGTFIKPA